MVPPTKFSSMPLANRFDSSLPETPYRAGVLDVGAKLRHGTSHEEAQFATNKARLLVQGPSLFRNNHP
jgi:hypothetical protein